TSSRRCPSGRPRLRSAGPTSGASAHSASRASSARSSCCGSSCAPRCSRSAPPPSRISSPLWCAGRKGRRVPQDEVDKGRESTGHPRPSRRLPSLRDDRLLRMRAEPRLQEIESKQTPPRGEERRAATRLEPPAAGSIGSQARKDEAEQRNASVNLQNQACAAD